MPVQTPNFLHELKDSGYDVRLFGKNHALDDESLKASLTEYRSNKPAVKSIWADSPGTQKKLAKNLFSSDYSMLLPPTPDSEIENMEDTKTVMDGIDFLEHADHNKPFFLMISINQPHAPYTCPEKFYNLCSPDEIRLKRRDLEGQPSFMHLVRSVSRFENTPDSVFQKCAAVYLGMISYTRTAGRPSRK
jgi:choline-sulfatase